MTNEDRLGFAELLKGVYDFYGRDLSDASITLWWEATKQFDLDVIRKALGQHVMNPDTGQFIPKPADVVKMMGGTTQDAGLVAWSKFARALESLGTYRTVVFDDPLIHRVVEDMRGWTVVGMCNAKDWPFRENEFVTRYRGYKMRGETPPYAPRLIGIFDGSNAANGFSVGDDNLVLVGDQERARLVLAGGTATPKVGLTAMSALTAKTVEKLEAK